MAQPFPAVLGGPYSALEGGWQSNGNNGLNLPVDYLITNLSFYLATSDGDRIVIEID